MPGKTRTSRRARTRPAPQPRGGAKALHASRFLTLLETVRSEVDVRLSGLLDAQVDVAREHGPEVVEMVRGLRELSLRGGKRLRAALVVAGYRTATTNAPLEPALDAGVAVELIQSYFLIHDDWMDRDETRRGGPAVHKLLADKYGSEALGSYSAVLAGDYAAALAQEAFSRLDVPPARLVRALSAFSEMQTNAVAGQQLDVHGPGASIEKTYELKTGSYTVAGPLMVGALLGGAPEQVVAGLERFALPTGVAFQLRDDLLSAFGNPKETGKPFASDIRSGKRTVLMNEGLERAKGRDREILERAWGNGSATDKELEAAVHVLERSGAKQAVERRITTLSARARRFLSQTSIPTARQALLLDAIDILTARKS